MTDEQTITRKEFPNGDVAVDEGSGLVYRTSDAAYTVELDPPGHPLSGEPFGVDLVRTTRSPHGLQQEQRLTLAEYPSYMSAEEHMREAEKTLLEQGREGLQPAMTLVDTMPYEPDSAMYIVGLYPYAPDTDRGTLSLVRLDGERLDVAPVAHGPIAELTPIEERLWDVKTGGDTGRLLEAAALEAMRADELAPGTPLFAAEGQEMTLDKAGVTPEWEDHPDWPDLSAWDHPPTPRPGALVLPVTLGDDMTPFDDRGRYVPHHRDEANTVHFFSVVGRPSDSPLPEDVSHELRYFRAQKGEDDIVIHDSLPVMPVTDPTLSPWPLPALHLHLEDGDLDTAQKLAWNTARDNGLAFPDKLPVVVGGIIEPESKPETGWYHFDTALVSATPQGVDDGYSVGVVDVYANHENGQWAARYLPMDEFDTLDEALIYQQQTLISRIAEDRESALATGGFNHSPAAYERIALADSDAALVDLLEKYDGHYPPNYEGYEPEWEALSSKEWDAYRDHVRTISEVVPGTDRIHHSLPTATPRFADETLVAASIQPDAPYLQAEDFDPQDIAPTWRLDIVPARDPDGAQLGYSAVCVVDFGDLAEALSPEAPQRAQWLEVAQFQSEERANQFREDFMSVAGMEELSDLTGPGLAEAVAGDLGMSGGWQVMNKKSLEKLKAGEWQVTHKPDEWEPRIGENATSTQAMEAASPGIDL